MIVAESEVRVRILAFLIALAFAATSVAGCSRVAGGAVGGGVHRPLRIGYTFEFRSLDTLANDGFASGTLNALVYGYLLRTDSDGRLRPDLAVAVPTLADGGVSPDGRTITYRLRRDVRWQDGRPLTASDVAFTYRAIMNPRNAVGSRFPYARLASVRAAGPWTVVVRLKAPDASIVGTLFTADSNYGILPEHVLGGLSELNDVAFDAMPVGSGPFRVARWNRGTDLRLDANPTYFRGKPGLDAIDLRFVPDTTTVVNQLRTGELDAFLTTDAALLGQFRALPDRVVTTVPYVGALFAAFNVERPLVRDVAMRRALASAIDRERLAHDVLHNVAGASRPSRGLFSYADDPAAPWPRFDPHATAVALDALGWRLGSDGFRHRDGTTLALQTIYANRSSSDRVEAVTIQRDLANVGVRLDLQAIAFSQFWLHASDGGRFALGKFDLALAGYSSDVDPDVSWLLACRERAPNGYNESRYCNPAVDRGLADATRALDPARRLAALRRVERRVASDAPFLPLVQLQEIDVMPRSLRGFVPNGTLPYDSAAGWSWAP